jgi:hypothetical protein
MSVEVGENERMVDSTFSRQTLLKKGGGADKSSC